MLQKDAGPARLNGPSGVCGLKKKEKEKVSLGWIERERGENVSAQKEERRERYR